MTDSDPATPRARKQSRVDMILLAIASLAIGVLLSVGVRVLLRDDSSASRQPVGDATPETTSAAAEARSTGAKPGPPVSGHPLPQAAATDAAVDPASPRPISGTGTGDTPATAVTGKRPLDTAATAATHTHILYRVRRGDTLWAIAAALTGNPYDCWTLWPDRTPHGEDLEVGTLLKVPISALTVVPGPTRN